MGSGDTCEGPLFQVYFEPDVCLGGALEGFRTVRLTRCFWATCEQNNSKVKVGGAITMPLSRMVQRVAKVSHFEITGVQRALD